MLALSLLSAFALIPCTGSSLCAATPCQQELVQIGARPQHDFTEEVFNGPAMRSLTDFSDKPLLVTFYSLHCGACVGGAVPSVLRLQREYGDSLQVLFVETWAEPQKTRAFALQRGWLGSQAMWTNEAPFRVPGRQVPTAVLLSGSGEVVLSANPLARKRELEQAIEHEVQVASTAPEDVPEELQRAWTQYRRGKIGRAIALAQREAEVEDPRVSSAAARALKTFRARGSAQIAWIERLVDTGYYVRAEALTETLRAGVRGDRELEARLAEVSARLEAPELKREREAAHALVEIENDLLLEGPGSETIERLDGFLSDFEGTKAARRARQLRDLTTLL